MFRLVIVSGPSRGASFILNDGDHRVGRGESCEVVLTSEQVSKEHCKISVFGETVTLTDDQSTNGTFLNGVLRKKSVIKVGDRISVGPFILELARVSSVPAKTELSNGTLTGFTGVSAIHSAVSVNTAPENQKKSLVAPESLPEKLVFEFEHKFMPLFYKQLMRQDLKSVWIAPLLILVLVCIAATAIPIMDIAEGSVRREAMARARALSREVVDRYAPAIAAKNESSIDLSHFERDPDVGVVTILNLDGGVIAPQSRINQVFTAGLAGRFAHEFAQGLKARKVDRGSGRAGQFTAVWIEPITVVDPDRVTPQTKAIAVVAVDFSKNIIGDSVMGVILGSTLVFAGLVGFLVYWLLIRLTLKPFQVLNDDIDAVLRGEISRVTDEFKIDDVKGLWSNVNALIHQSGGSGNDPVVQQNNWGLYGQQFSALAQVSGAGFFGIDDQGVIFGCNEIFESMSGIRQDSLGSPVESVSRDQAFNELIKDLKERVKTLSGAPVQDQFEFSGVQFQLAAFQVGQAPEGMVVFFKNGGAG